MSATAEEEFTAFVQARQDRLVGAAFLVCGDHHHAQDLVQEALVKLASRWEQVRDGSPEAYVRRILYRDAVSRWRRWGREQPRDLSSPEAPALPGGGSDPADTWVEGAEVRQALAQLPPRQRAVLVLRYYEDLSEVRIAEVLGISPGTVKSQASRALATLRRLVPELAAATEGGGSR